MGYRLDKNLNKKHIRNKKLKNRLLLAVIVFTLSIISNSIIPKTLLVTATENSKFEIDSVIAGEKVTSDDNVFEITREVEKVSESEINVSVNIKINKNNISVVNNEIANQDIKEVTENEVDNADETQEVVQNETANEDVQNDASGIDEQSVGMEKYTSNIFITEGVIEGFSIVNDSIKLEEVKAEGNVDLTETLRNSEYTDLSMGNLESKLNITLKNISYSEVKISYSIITNSSIKELDNVALFSESLLKYNLVENDEEKIANIPNTVVSVKALILESNDVENNYYLQESEETTVEDGVENSEDMIATYSTASNTKDKELSNGVTVKGVNWARTKEVGNKNKINSSKGKVELTDPKKNIGEVLITDRYDGKNTYYTNIFDYKYLLKYLNPTETKNVWDGRSGDSSRYYSGYITDNYLKKNNYPVEDFSTWAHLNDNNDNNKNTEYSWRLFRGEFNLSAEDLADKKVYIGVASENGVQSIMPFNDTMIVLIDGKVTNINYSTGIANLTLKNTNNSNTTQELNFQKGYQYTKYGQGCNIKEHDDLSRHTDGWHAHLDATTNSTGTRLGDITSYVNTVGPHKLEILCGDYDAGGGGTKLEIYLVEDTAINVTKVGYLSKDGQKQVIDDSTKIYEKDTVNYTFSMTNTGERTIKNAVFTDKLLDSLEINSNGVFIKDGDIKKEVADYSKLKITKGNLQYNGVLVNKEEMYGKRALRLLIDIEYGKTIIIEDINNIKYIVKSNEIEVINKVKGIASYSEGKSIDKSAEFTFKVYRAPSINDDKVTITKIVKSISRNDKKVSFTTDTNKVVSAEILPGDIVEFEITVENGCYRIDYDTDINGIKSGIAVEGLTLNDQLSIGDYKKDINLKDGSFDLDAPTIIDGKVISSTKTFYYEWTVTDYEANLYRNVVNNNVDLKNGKDTLDQDFVEMKIQPPSLLIEKVISNDSLSDSYSERTFTIMVNGDNKKQYNIEAEASMDGKKVYNLENLKYGVTYTVSEIVPMNYEQQSITINGERTKSIKLTAANSGAKVQITNKKINAKFWSDDSKAVNTFGYKTNISTQ